MVEEQVNITGRVKEEVIAKRWSKGPGEGNALTKHARSRNSST